jgi:Protein of unknown function (DUF3172)
MSRSPYGRSGTPDSGYRDGRSRDRGGDGWGERDRYGEGRPPREGSRGPYGDRGERQGRGGSGSGGPGRGGNDPGGAAFQFNIATVAVLAGVLIVGIGIGTGLSSTTQGNQGNIASSQQLDMAVADPEFCKQYGASAFVQDIQLYTTMNPSTSFVTQPKLQPGCVIRRENWAVLQKEGAITAEQMRQCKQRMNTFAYIGSVKDKPEVRCVYQTDTVDNKFVTKGVADDTVGVTPEADQF